MRTLTLSKADLPLWDFASASLDVALNVPAPTDLDAPLDPAMGELFDLDFGMAGSQEIAIGSSGSLAMGFGVQADTRILFVWPSTAGNHREMLEALQLDGYFQGGAHANRLMAFFVAGAGVTGNVDAEFAYSVISAGASLDAGVDAGLTVMRSYPVADPAKDVVTDLIEAIRLPAHIEAPPIDDEIVALDYSGYLNLSGSLGFGYSMAGTVADSIAGIKLSEKYSVSVLGNVGVSAGIAGDFRIEVRNAGGNWANVSVRKNRETGFGIAADVTVGATLEGRLPYDAGRDFIGALVGVNTQSFFGVVDEITKYSDLEQLDANLDALAKSFIEEWTGKAFDALDQTAVADLLARAAKISDAYRNLDRHAIELFDKYFDQADTLLVGKLEEVLQFAGWDALEGDVDPDLIRIVEVLTDGDPLAWVLGQVEIGGQPVGLDKLQERARSALDFVRDTAHREIRELIALVKAEFALDELFDLVDTLQLDNLHELSDKKLAGFASRLIGRAVDEIKEHDKLVEAIDEVHRVCAAIGAFPDTLKEKIEDALNQKWSLALHAEYNRSDARGALVDFDVDLSTDSGRRLMRSAGRGDLDGVLGAVTATHVRVNDGLLTRRMARESGVAFNIVGWHFGFTYQSMAKVIVESSQRIQREEDGLISVFTTAELEFEEETQKAFRGNSERVYSNFLMRLAGESSGLVEYVDNDTHGYMIDVIKGMSASYNLVIEDTETTATELADYLSTAQELGLLADVASTTTGVARLLPIADDGSYGETSLEYHVRFVPEALREIFTHAWSASLLESLLRRHVLESYLQISGRHAEVGWAYSTPAVEGKFRAEANRYTSYSSSPKVWRISSGNNPPKPKTVTLDSRQHNWLNTLYLAEDKMVAAIQGLSGLLRGGEKINPAVLDNRLLDFGQALRRVSKFDGCPSSAFAVIDGMINTLEKSDAQLAARLAPEPGSTNRSRLTINATATVDGETKSTRKELFA